MLNQLNKYKEIDPNKNQVSSHSKPMIDESLKLSAPAWPLQNTVAVNPFWFLRNQAFDQAISEVSSAIQTSLMMPISFYQDKVHTGEISSISLQEAFKSTIKLWPSLPNSLDELIQRAKGDETAFLSVKTFAEYADESGNMASRVISELGKYAAAYLDDRQALAPFPLTHETFWIAWIEMQEFDSSMDILGVQGFQAIASTFKGFDSVQAISLMMNDIGLTPISQQIYLQRLSSSVLGWSTQFKHLEWQCSLGYGANRNTSTTDLLAVRLAYDYILFKLTRHSHSTQTAKWLRELEKNSENKESLVSCATFQLQYIYQLAWELTYQNEVVRQLKSWKIHNSCIPRAQMVFCIDVRSEMIRRHIEMKDPTIQTIGFAGFFGLPFDFQRCDENQAGHRLPVLLKPLFTLKECSQENTENKKGILNTNHCVTGGYFRSLRKNSLSSIAYVELFGVFYIEKMLHELWSILFSRAQKNKIPSRFEIGKVKLDSEHLKKADGETLQTQEIVLRLAAVLRHMGLTSEFADQVWIVGHGSETRNNAFGSSLDCGACGGHAGDINAKLLVALLNDSSIRAGLREEKIEIPDRTLFISAVHETVTDEIYPLELSDIPQDKFKLIEDVYKVIQGASQDTRLERQEARSGVLDSSPKRRTQNWAEVRPEWGLAGNACFIVAPRERTKGINLSSRSFLHDYDWRKDKESGYQTLELIMTAPMVVTNWINLQYYASTVAPRVYGAGNKILHNLTNEVGVVEGNGGDLRIGLPFQSIHDGHRFIHEPLRLSVFIEAPQEQIEKFIQKHQVVRELVENEWLHLLHIDSTTFNVSRRLRTGEYI